ncbi:MAG: proton-conducting transporter membrane subunit, partial [Candidatus Sericytochromatia bacterium]
AFFKALLFLGAGSVIHAMHHHEDMAHYGGLRKVIPFTYAIMLVGCLAIAGIWPFAGFFSKDAILLAAFEGGQYWIYAIALFTGGLTAFYMFRMLFLTFHGKPRDPEAYHHAHEGPWTMWLPLLVLAIGSTVVGFLGNPIVWGGSAFAAWLEPSLPHVAHHAVSASMEYTLMALAVIVGALGILIAHLKYGPHRKPALAPSGNPLWQLFSHLYFFDVLYRNMIVRPLLALSRAGLYRVIDRQAIDGTVNGLPRIYTGVASAVRYLQTGVVRQYALAMLLGLVAILLIVVTRFSVFRF